VANSPLFLLCDAAAACCKLLTALAEIKTHEERLGRSPPQGKAYSRNFRGPNWLDLRKAAAEYAELLMVREAVPYLPILFPAPISDRRTRVLGSTSLYRERTWPSRWADSSLKTKQRVCNRADEADAGHLSLGQILAKIIRRACGTSCNRADLGATGGYPISAAAFSQDSCRNSGRTRKRDRSAAR
jgi:hypothetical protein